MTHSELHARTPEDVPADQIAVSRCSVEAEGGVPPLVMLNGLLDAEIVSIDLGCDKVRDGAVECRIVRPHHMIIHQVFEC